MERELVLYPDPRLKMIADPVVDEFNSAWLVQLVRDMENMIETNEIKGVGLAAIQISVNKSVIIYKDRSGVVHALCNPKIISRFGKITSYDEGCLSVPGFKADVKRSKGVKVKAQTIEGKDITVKERGYVGIILQHEIDHTNGREFIDRVANSKEKHKYIDEVTNV